MALGVVTSPIDQTETDRANDATFGTILVEIAGIVGPAVDPFRSDCRLHIIAVDCGTIGDNETAGQRTGGISIDCSGRSADCVLAIFGCRHREIGPERAVR